MPLERVVSRVALFPPTPSPDSPELESFTYQVEPPEPNMVNFRHPDVLASDMRECIFFVLIPKKHTEPAIGRCNGEARPRCIRSLHVGLPLALAPRD